MAKGIGMDDILVCSTRIAHMYLAVVLHVMHVEAHHMAKAMRHEHSYGTCIGGLHRVTLHDA